MLFQELQEYELLLLLLLKDLKDIERKEYGTKREEYCIHMIDKRTL